MNSLPRFSNTQRRRMGSSWGECSLQSSSRAEEERLLDRLTTSIALSKQNTTSASTGSSFSRISSVMNSISLESRKRLVSITTCTRSGVFICTAERMRIVP